LHWLVFFRIVGIRGSRKEEIFCTAFDQLIGPNHCTKQARIDVFAAKTDFLSADEPLIVLNGVGI